MGEHFTRQKHYARLAHASKLAIEAYEANGAQPLSDSQWERIRNFCNVDLGDARRTVRGYIAEDRRRQQYGQPTVAEEKRQHSDLRINCCTKNSVGFK